MRESIVIIVAVTLLSVSLGADEQNERLGLITAKRGLRVRSAPSLGADKKRTLPFKTYVSIIETTDTFITVDGIRAPWLHIKYWDRHKGGDEEGYVFGGHVFTGEPKQIKFPYHYSLIEEYLVKANGKIKIEKNKNIIKIGLKNGKVKTFITSSDPLLTGWYLVDFFEDQEYYLFASIYHETDTSYFLIDYRDGKQYPVHGIPVFNSDGTSAVCTRSDAVWGNAEVGIFIYQIKGRKPELVYKHGLIPEYQHNHHLEARWVDNMIRIDAPLMGTAVVPILIKGHRGAWRLTRPFQESVAISVVANRCIRFKVNFHETEQEYPDSEDYYGAYTLNSFFIDDNDDSGPVKIKVESASLVFKKDGTYNWSNIKRLFDFFYKYRETIFGDNVQGYYDVVRKYVRMYTRFYRVMTTGSMKKELMNHYNIKTKNEMDRMRLLYKDLIIAYNLDLKAGVLPRRSRSYIVGFWLRRMHDGSDVFLYSSLIKIMKEYDTAYYNKYIVGNGITVEEMKKFPDATLKFGEKNDYRDCLAEGKNKWWDERRESRVQVSGRQRLNGGEDIYYTVTLDNKKAMVREHCLSFNEK